MVGVRWANIHSQNAKMQAEKTHIAKILDRIKTAYQLETDANVAKFLNIATSTLSSWKKRGRANYVRIFAKCEDLNLHWLITGEGMMKAGGDERVRTRRFGVPDDEEELLIEGEEMAIARIPMYLCPVPAGAPMPIEANDEEVGWIDIVGVFVPSLQSCFACRVTGDSMIGVGIDTGDIVVVDRTATPSVGKIIVIAINGELTMKRIERSGDQVFLFPENERYKPIPLLDSDHYIIFGVVVRAIKMF
ncbi:MAG: hypothetical protein DYG96_08360 [Chlorobi bacterium CHB2]|nr:hypothetical protein [Chlorobi bacterium CHB2]